MQNCNYNKTRLLADMKSVLWRIRHYYKKDATKAKHASCGKILKHMERELTKFTGQLESSVTQLAKKGKFK